LKWTGFGGKPTEGVVIRTRSDKSIMVQVDRWIRDPLYKVERKRTTRLKVHDENNICHVGDQVLVVPSRPYSKTKRWALKEIIKKDAGMLYLAKHPELYISPLQLREARRDEMVARTMSKKEIYEHEQKKKQQQLEELKKKLEIEQKNLTNATDKSATGKQKKPQ